MGETGLREYMYQRELSLEWDAQIICHVKLMQIPCIGQSTSYIHLEKVSTEETREWLTWD